MLSQLKNQVSLLSQEFNKKFYSKFNEELDQRTAQQLEKLQLFLITLSERVLQYVSDILNFRTTKFSQSQTQIDLLQSSIEKLDNTIASLPKESSFQKMVALSQDIVHYRKRIAQIQDGAPNKQEISIEFNQEQIFRTLTGMIRVDNIDQFSQKLLISPHSVFNLEERKMRFNKHSLQIVPASSVFQLQQKLYMAGGMSSDCKTHSDYFCSLNYASNVTQLPSLLQAKHSTSLTGRHSHLVISGGRREHATLRAAQKYNIKKKKWVSIPEMNHVRKGHSSCFMVQGLFCFFGNPDFQIEKLQTEGDQQWKDIPCSIPLEHITPLLAVYFQNEILIFTDNKNQSGLLVFDSEGQYQRAFKLRNYNFVKSSYIVSSQYIYASTCEGKFYKFKGLEWSQI